MGEVCHLKVLHVASGDLWAGAEVQLFTLAKALHTRADISVCVVLLNYGRLEQELYNAGINVFVLDESKLSGLRILSLLVQTIREQNPDVVHTHRLKENILGSIAAFIAGRTPSMSTMHGAPEHPPSWWEFRKRILFSLNAFCMRFLQQKVIAVSDDLAEILRKEFPAEHIRVIENGIDLSVIHNERVSRPAKQGIYSQFEVGLSGRLVTVKRIDLYIETAQYFRVNYPHLRANFHIYGDGPMRKELEALSERSGTGNIVFFEGHSSDMIRQLMRLDVLLMTSDHEGLPMILLEAMALEIPVIAHAVGGIPGLLDYGACGILVNEQNPRDYAEAIYKIACNTESLSNMVQNARTRVHEYYTAEQNAQAYCTEYFSLLKA